MTVEEVCIKMHKLAKAELGVHEIAGANANKRIVEYASHTTLKATSDEIAWCSSFVNAITDYAGIEGTNSAAAKSWLNWGSPIEKPILGCVVVLPRRDPNNPNAAHVALCDHPDISNGIIRVIGGNQSDSVSVSRYKTLGAFYRVPKLEISNG